MSAAHNNPKSISLDIERDVKQRVNSVNFGHSNSHILVDPSPTNNFDSIHDQVGKLNKLVTQLNQQDFAKRINYIQAQLDQKADKAFVKDQI